LQISPSIPSAILPALPFVFLTQDRDVFSAAAFEQSQLSADVQVTKLFSKSDVQALQEEFLQVRDMGQGTVAEWLKGLPGRCSDLQHDASKWEKWESSGGTTRMCSLLYPGYERRSPAPLPQKLSAGASVVSSLTQGRHERTAGEAVELKAARKAEIERRALLLEPPLTADVLRHIPSFQAAIHLVTQLDDDAWERLKPRLLAQRADAERAWESERIAEGRVNNEIQEQQPVETTLAAEKEARDRIDKNWEEVQAPLRAKIAGYADEAVQENRGKDRKVTRENCSRFAVDSLLSIRRRFYAEEAKSAAVARAAGQTPPVDPPEGPWTQKLTLENMKWIFDTKIKPHTEPLRKDLFYCNGCEGNFKPFGLEGVIQHYAAKHTSILSLGSIVVHWRAEWPEHPPFSATPRPAKAVSHPQGTGPFAASGVAPLPASYNYPPAGTVPLPAPPIYPPLMGYGYTPPTYNDYNQQPPPPPLPYQQQLTTPPHFLPQPGYEQHPPYVTPPAAYLAYQPPTAPYPPPVSERGQSHMPPQGVPYDYHYGPYPTHHGSGSYAPPQASTYPDLYPSKVEDIAHNSREVWRLLGDIRDLPGSAKVLVTIHHLVKRFQSRFYETPPLSMFIDGLSNNKEMRPVRNVNGLICKACHLGLGNAASVEQERKDFSLPQLANHFQSKHVEPMQRMPAAFTPLDWVTDMVFVSDLAVSASLASPANEPQRALLSAALLPACAPQPVSAVAGTSSTQHENEEVHTQVQQATPARIHNGFRASGAYASSQDVSDPAGAGSFADYRFPDQSPHSTTPGTTSEGGLSTQRDSTPHSSQGHKPSRGQNGFHHKNAAGKNKRVKPQGGSGSGDRSGGKKFRAGDGKRKRETSDVDDMRAVNQDEMPPAHMPSAGPQRSKPGVVVQGQAHLHPNARPLQHPEKTHPPASAHGEQEPSIMAALESYLEQRQLPQFRGSQGRSNSASNTDQRDPEAIADLCPGSGTYTRYGADREESARSSLPSTRARSPAGRQPDPAYHQRPAAVERRDDSYGPQRSQAGFIELSSRHLGDDRFGLPATRTEDRDHNAPLPEGHYRRYHDDVRVQSRPPVEAYEIVHVIDEQGEYYIRRPVRREPDPRYMYEERRVRHEAGPYSGFEPTYAPVSRSSLAREGARASAAPEGRPGDRRADPAYYEEYDPRFPAA